MIDTDTADLIVRLYLRKRTKILDGVLGVLAFTLGLGSAATENPVFYGWVSLFFVVLVGIPLLQPYERLLEFVREVKHAETKTTWSAEKHLSSGTVFLFGFIFLTLVAGGFLDKNGLHLDPHWQTFRDWHELSRLAAGAGAALNLLLLGELIATPLFLRLGLGRKLLEWPPGSPWWALGCYILAAVLAGLGLSPKSVSPSLFLEVVALLVALHAVIHLVRFWVARTLR